MKNINDNEVIRKRFNRFSKFYDILEIPMDIISYEWRRELAKYSSGKVLEVGVGTGKNVPFYPSNTDITAIDFSRGMLAKAIEKFRNLSHINFIQADIQKTGFETEVFDTVIASFVFCSVPDPVKGLKEVKRVCKKGGKIILLEHVRSKNKILGTLMDWFNPITVRLFGYNINRNTTDNLCRSGLENFHERNLRLDILKMYIIENTK